MPYLRSRFPLLYRIAAYLALLAILVPAGTGLVHNPAAAQSFIHICGLDQHNGDQGKVPAHKLPSCPICQSLHLLGGGFMPPDALAVAAVDFAAPDYVPANSDFNLEPAAAPQARPRAPPVLA